MIKIGRVTVLLGHKTAGPCLSTGLRFLNLGSDEGTSRGQGDGKRSIRAESVGVQSGPAIERASYAYRSSRNAHFCGALGRQVSVPRVPVGHGIQGGRRRLLYPAT